MSIIDINSYKLSGGKDREVFTSGTYPWSFETDIS
jgi:hypothetical protein